MAYAHEAMKDMARYSDTKKEEPRQGEECCTLDGHIYPASVVNKIAVRAHGTSALALTGPPGGGKTFFAGKGLPLLLEDLFDVPYAVAYTQPFQLKNASDTFCKPSLRQGNLVWDLTWPVHCIKKARQENKAVLYIVEEFNRMDARGQNFLLELCGSKTIHIEHTGESIELPPFSRVCLIGNSRGMGVSQKHEALHDRLAVVHWPIPTPKTMSRMLLTSFENGADKEFRARKTKTSFGGRLARRELTPEVAEVLAEVAHSMNPIRKEPASMRALERCVSLYMSLPDLEDAVNSIVEEELARDLDKNEPEVRRGIIRAKDRLRFALIMDKRGRS